MCDKAKEAGFIGIEEFDECCFKKKIIPMLPDGTYPKVSSLVYYGIQK